MNRGDVVIVDFPFTSSGSKLRPALVVQNDNDNRRLTKTIVAMISGNTKRAHEPTHCLVEPATAEGASSGLHGPSVIVCVNLYTIEQSDVRRKIGLLSPELQTKIDNCLKVAFDLT
jgi:mRNA interferase MazF